MSAESDFAVSMMMAQWLVRAFDRSRRHTSYPSSPGIITSRRTASGRIDSALATASWPSWATWTVNPSRLRLSSTYRAMSKSSSTTRTVSPPPTGSSVSVTVMRPGSRLP